LSAKIDIKGVKTMAWVDVTKNILIADSTFQRIVSGLVFNCPSSIEHKVKDGFYENGKSKYKLVYKPVSARNSSFRNRGIEKNLFVTILAQIRRPLNIIKTYALIDSSASVEQTVKSIKGASTLSDPYYEIIVFQKRPDMTDTEAFYYYIRNAFAHGSFEVVSTNNGNIYLLESSKDGEIKAQMRLKDTSLKEYIRLANLSVAEIKALQKKK